MSTTLIHSTYHERRGIVDHRRCMIYNPRPIYSADGQLGSGETVTIPLKSDGSFSQDPVDPITYSAPYPYSHTPAKFPTRQNGPHVHGITTDSKSRVYICDLGSDATWVAESSEEGTGLKVVGMMERTRGDTPRHALVPDDGMSTTLTFK